CRLAENFRLVGGEIENAVADDAVRTLGGERNFLDVSLDVGDIAEPVTVTQAFRLLQLSVGHIDADDLAACPDLQGGDEAVHAGPAPEINDRLPLLEGRKV